VSVTGTGVSLHFWALFDRHLASRTPLFFFASSWYNIGYQREACFMADSLHPVVGWLYTNVAKQCQPDIT